jgi:hypothetical protein
MRDVLITTLLLCLACLPVLASVYPPPKVDAEEIAQLRRATAWVRACDEAALVKLVPEQSGLFFVGCPNCNQGTQENQLTWTPEHPEEVTCRYCGEHYPSARYPMNKTLTVHNPLGQLQHYPYWEDAKGYRYFFQARRDYLVRGYLEARTRDLALLYALTGDKDCARRAALLLDRFAQVFPGYCYHYDYPFRQKEIYDGAVPPAQFRANYRTARWTWWAYMDVPTPLVEAYDWIRDSGALEALSRERGLNVAERIETDLFRNAAEQVMANPEEYSNMSPGMWRSLIQVGRVLGEPRYVHEPVRRLRRFVAEQFFYDGSWHEGAPSYAAQTVGNLEEAVAALKGYSDPPGYKDPQDGTHFTNLDPVADLPVLRLANRDLQQMRLPDGRLVPVHDTWWFNKRQPLAATQPYLLPALGHACLGGGEGTRQTQLHLTWSGGYGHQHADGLSLLLFAEGWEMLSDLGYTHTRYRSWASATAAHNTVVIDGANQASGSRKEPSDGSLRWFDTSDPHVQVVSVDNLRAYPGKATIYRRSLVLIDAGEGRRYAVDLFEAAGGTVHDYFLHGDADAPCTAQTSLTLTPLNSLLPAGDSWRPPQNEDDMRASRPGDYAYGFLRDLREAAVPAGVALPVTFITSAGTDSASAPSLRVTLFPEADSRLILGTDPSIRPAHEDDAKLDQFTRPFLLLRHEAGQGRSMFAAVLEPFTQAPFLTAIERLPAAGTDLALRIRLGDRTDLVVLGAKKPVAIPVGHRRAIFQGEVGVLSLRGEEPEHAYALGGAGWKLGDWRQPGSRLQSRTLRAIEGSELVLQGAAARLPRVGDVVYMETADGWRYPFTIDGAQSTDGQVRLHVAQGPGMTYDAAAKRLRLTAFPQREHSGAVQVAWYAP